MSIVPTIHRYELNDFGPTTLTLPLGATFIHVGFKKHTLCAWAIVDPSLPPKEYVFQSFRTGEALPYFIGSHIGTAIYDPQDTWGSTITAHHVFVR